MIGTDDIYEFRTDNNGKFYRLCAFWDSRDGKQTLIVCTHGLIKKTNKTPKSEIAKAEDIKDKYFKGLI
jgi:phage-related protein